MKRFPLALTAALGATVLLAAGCAFYRIDEARTLAAASEPFSVAPTSAGARLLIVGDSTGVGTGASSPAMSVAGQLSSRLPALAIDNVAANGARFADVVAQLDAAGARRYDAVLIMAGGNDVMRLTAETKLRREIEDAAGRATKIAPMVIFMPSGNVGNAPFFFPPVSWWMSARSRLLHGIVREAAARNGAAYVNLYQPKETDPFAKEPKRLHAADGLHPDDAGYRLWLHELVTQSPVERLVPPRAQR
ncbi:MAG: GDSL-type esterase/lipase family protein [Casimicrobiaceae bacterium]